MRALAFGEPATILRAGPSTYDDYGNSVPGPDTETVVDGCGFGPGSTNEQYQGQDVLTIDANLYMPPGTDVVYTDRIRFRDVEYTIYGQPADFRSPLTGRRGPIVVSLRKVQ